MLLLKCTREREKKTEQDFFPKGESNYQVLLRGGRSQVLNVKVDATILQWWCGGGLIVALLCLLLAEIVGASFCVLCCVSFAHSTGPDNEHCIKCVV